MYAVQTLVASYRERAIASSFSTCGHLPQQRDRATAEFAGRQAIDYAPVCSKACNWLARVAKVGRLRNTNNLAESLLNPVCSAVPVRRTRFVSRFTASAAKALPHAAESKERISIPTLWDHCAYASTIASAADEVQSHKIREVSRQSVRVLDHAVKLLPACSGAELGTELRSMDERLRVALEEGGPILRSIALRLCTVTAEADDLVQETFVRAVERGFPVEVHNPIGWLVAMMHNLFIDRCRAEARRPTHEPIDDTAHTTVDDSQPPWSDLTIEDIRSALEELDPLYRETYTIQAFEGLSYQRIAEHLGIDPITVGTRLTRARQRLREVLIRRFGFEEEA